MTFDDRTDDSAGIRPETPREAGESAAADPGGGTPATEAGTPPPAPGETGPALPSLPRRVLEVFLSPGELFEALARRPAWLGAFLLGGVIVAAGALLVPQELYVEMMREQAGQAGGGSAGAEGAPDVETIAGFARIAGVVMGAIFWGVYLVLWAGAATLIFAIVLGDDATFRQYFSATSHAFLIAAIGSVLIVPLKIAGGDMTLTLSVGTFTAPLLEGGYLQRVLTGLDLFGLWSLLVLAVAASRFERARGWGSAAAILGIVWIALAMVFGIFDFGSIG